MNTILRRVTRTANCLYQVSRFQQPSIIYPFVSSFNNFRLLSNDSVDSSPDTSKTFVISGPLHSEILSDKYRNIDVINKTLEILGENPKVSKWETIKSRRNRVISVELTSSEDVRSLLNNRGKLFNKGLDIMARRTPEEEMELRKILELKKAEDPTKSWVIRNGKVTNLEEEQSIKEEERTRTVVMEGKLTEEIESGSELPALEVINKVFNVLGHSPEIEAWDLGSIQRGRRAGTRSIFVKFVNVDDALTLMKDKATLKDYGKLNLNIRRTAAEQQKHAEEQRARTVVMRGQLTEEIESGSELPALEVINKVFTVLGHSPEIEHWNQSSVKKIGERLIFVRLANVDDALKLVKNKATLNDYGRVFLNIRSSAAEVKLHQEKRQKMMEDPSKFYYIHEGKVHKTDYRNKDYRNKDI